MASSRHSGESRAVGQFVLFPGSPGIGRVLEVNDETQLVLVEFFESIAEPSVGRVWVDKAGVRNCRLSAQTRVFVEEDNGWRAGRIVGGGPGNYAVRLPNTSLDLLVEEHRLRVRWEKPPRDPLQVLIANAQETPLFMDSRLPVRQLWLAERAATGSATGIMSSGVNLHPHQVNAAMRIIQDPVQRYLLADEVGMGKTIQAGFVIRQLLIDDTNSTVGVLVPRALVGQWQAELLEKFFVDDFNDGTGRSRLRVVRHEEVEEWGYLASCSLVVVDEAQLLADVPSPINEPYASLASIAKQVPRLLLVSATPSMQSDTTHLALLHLLDPEMYDWSDLDQFRQLRSVHRQLALAVFGLDVEPDPDNPEFLALQLEDIAALVPPDERLSRLCSLVMESFEEGHLAPQVTQADLNHRVAAVRSHVSETYRLHHRVIRHRRRRELGSALDDDGYLTPFEVTGRCRPVALQLPSIEMATGVEVVEDWLTSCIHHLLDTGVPVAGLGTVLGILVSRLGGPVEDLIAVLSTRVEGTDTRDSLSQDELNALTDSLSIPGEAEMLARLRACADADGLVTLTEAIIERVERTTRTIVFCGKGSLARRLALELAHFPEVRTLSHLSEDPDQADASVIEWRQSGGILVVDDSGEVGRNLQDAQVVIHARLPWNPNALEQRMGRIDRYGAPKPAKQHFVTDENKDGLHSAWASCLGRGFGVFSESISTLREPVEWLTVNLWDDVAANGVKALHRDCDSIAAQLQQEIKRVAEMDALEAAAEYDSLGKDLALQMSVFEAYPDHIEKSYLDLLAEAEGFRLVARCRLDGSTTFEQSTEHAPLISPRLLKRLATPETARTGFFDRWKLRDAPSRRLFRRGNPFVDAVESIVEIDDRGLASAMWRMDRSWQEDPLVYFGFDFLIQADILPALQVASETNTGQSPVRRRADLAFPPFSRRVWISADGNGQVTDEATLAFLGRPYKKPPHGTDTNLSAKRSNTLHDLLGGQEGFAYEASRAHRDAYTELNGSPQLTEVCASALSRLGAQSAVLAAQAEARHAASGLVVDARALNLDRDLSLALVEGVRRPDIRLMAVSCIVRSAISWRQYVQG